MTTEDGAKLWYVARDGKQTGPISDAEIGGIAAHGYFRPTDLVWRPGFPEWRPALLVFQAIAKPAPLPEPTQPRGPSSAGIGPGTRASSPSAGADPGQPREPIGPSREEQRRIDPAQNARQERMQHAALQRDQQQLGGAPGPEQLNSGQPNSGQLNPGQFNPGQTTSGQAYPGSAAGVPFHPRPFQPAPAGFGQVQPGPTTGRPLAPAPSGGQPLPYAYRPAAVGQPAGSAAGPLQSGASLQDPPLQNMASQNPSSQNPLNYRPLATTSAVPEPELSAVRPRTNRMALLALAITLIAIAGGVLVAAEPTLMKSGAMEPVRRSLASLASLVSGGANGKVASIETALQGTAHWPIIKREFPDWYGERLREAATLTAEKKSPDDVDKMLAERIVALRRQNSAQALSASMPRLMAVANAFLENLRQLKAFSPQVCYSFISQGELTPAVLEKLKLTGQSPPPAIQVQVAAIFEAIAEGRVTPTVHAKPQKEDYDLLMGELGKLGWTQDDVATFANPRSLARTEPARVCQMVQDWFVAHIAIDNVDTRGRLIGETLRPVVSG